MLSLVDTFWSLYHWSLRIVDPLHPVSLVLKAEEALRRQEWGRAFDCSNAALKKRSDFVAAYLSRGMARLHLDDYAGALRDLGHYLALEEDPPEVVYYWRGWIYAHKREWSLALSDFDRLLRLRPDDAQAHYWRSYVLWQREEWERMRASLEQLERLRPDSPLAWELRGHLLLHDAAFEEAEAAYTRAMEGGWESPDLRYNRALARRHLERHDEARQDIEAIFRLDPDNSWAHLELGNFAFAAGDYDEALRHARTAIELNSQFFEARLNEAAALMALDRPTEAREQLEAIRRDFPSEPVVEQLYGDVLAIQQLPAAAVASYRVALSGDPENNTVRLKLASELITLGQFEEALTLLDLVLADEPDDRDALATRADLHRHNNQPEAMRTDLDHLIALEPRHSWALAFRGYHRYWCGDEKGALEDYTTALESDPSHGWIWAFRGQFHLRCGRHQAARDDFQRAITIAPEDPWLRRQWADVLYFCEQSDRAAHVLDCLIEDEPDDGFARLFRAELHLISEEGIEAGKHLKAIIEAEHELSWLAHAALAVLEQGEARQRHLALADEQRPEPSYWGMSPATVLAQRALVVWQRGDRSSAERYLCDSLLRMEPGETPWLALRPLFVLLDAAPLVAQLARHSAMVEAEGTSASGD